MKGLPHAHLPMSSVSCDQEGTGFVRLSQCVIHMVNYIQDVSTDGKEATQETRVPMSRL